MADAIPCSSVYLPVFAFTSRVTFKYGDLSPSWRFAVWHVLLYQLLTATEIK